MDPFIGQIIMFGGNFAPRNWALCDGQLLPIAQNQALFSILGTTYGGDGRTTFQLPDLRSRVAMHAGHGPGLADRRLGAKGGAETTTLNTNNLPSHSHTGHIKLADAKGDVNTITSTGHQAQKVSDIDTGDKIELYQSNATFNNGAKLEGVVTDPAGQSQAFNNVQPFQCVNYIICLFGTFPSRS